MVESQWVGPTYLLLSFIIVVSLPDILIKKPANLGSNNGDVSDQVCPYNAIR